MHCGQQNPWLKIKKELQEYSNLAIVFRNKLPHSLLVIGTSDEITNVLHKIPEFEVRIYAVSSDYINQMLTANDLDDFVVFSYIIMYKLTYL